MNADFKKLLDSHIPEVRNLAKSYYQLELDFTQGDLSEDEFKELTDDLFRLKSIKDDMRKLKIIDELHSAISILLALQGSALLI